MNGRERVMAAIKYGSPDRVPIMHRSLPGAFRVHGEALVKLYERYPSDVMLSPTLSAPFAFAGHSPERFVGPRVIDEWGCEWHSATDDYAGQVIGHPLADLAALDSYRWPDPSHGSEGVDEMREVMRVDDHQHYFIAAAGTVMHQMTFLRGFENTLLDLAEQRAEILYIRDCVTNIVLKRINAWTEAGVDGVLIEDDWGTQEALMISPAMWRRIFKPIYLQLVQAIHAGGACAHLHSDGVIRSIIPDLIEIGFDEINPQVWIMDMDKLSQEFAGKICFRADLDRQWVLPRGSPAQVAEHVRQTYAAFGSREGGYIGYGQVGPDVPLDNAEAMLRTFTELTPMSERESRL
jgi:uroporphyrinogen decarboxylase